MYMYIHSLSVFSARVQVQVHETCHVCVIYVCTLYMFTCVPCKIRRWLYTSPAPSMYIPVPTWTYMYVCTRVHVFTVLPADYHAENLRNR